MNKRKFILIIGGLELLLVALMFLAPVWVARAVTASYNSTVRIVNSAGTVLDGVASAVTANYNSTVRVVDSNNNVIDAFSSPQPTPAGGYPLTQANGGTGATSLNGAYIGQTVVSQSGQPLVELDGVTYAVETPLVQVTIPANTLDPWAILQCHAYGIYQNNTGATQNVLLRSYFGTTQTVFNTMQSTQANSSLSFRNWAFDMYVLMGSAAAKNDLYGMITWGSTTGILGNMANAAPTIYSGIETAANTDAASDQVYKVAVAIGVASPVPTYTAAPTSATTPITQVRGVWCHKWPGITPTPTATPTPTPAPTNTPAPTPT